MAEVLILSILQGITEFIPISSSSHLIIASEYLDFDNRSLSIDVSLHIGSFLAVLIFFRKDLLNFFTNRILFYKIVLSSIPIMIIGFCLVKFNLINNLRNMEVIGWTTIIFGILLYLSDKFDVHKKIEKDFSFKFAILIGLIQILSLVPGVSRSGIVISAARILKFNRYDSAKISFLLSIPTLAAVSFFGFINLISSNNLEISVLNLVSIILSFIFSYLTIKFFLNYIKKFNLNIFVLYRLIVGLILLVIVYS